MPDYKDPKVTKTDGKKDIGKWIGIAAAVVVLLLLIAWLLGWFGGEEVAAASSAVVEGIIAAG